MANDDLPADKPAAAWYIAREGQPHGPVKWEDLLELLQAGQLSAADCVWREGLENWVPLGSLAGATPPPLAPPPAPPPSPPIVSAAPPHVHGVTRPVAFEGRPRRDARHGRLLIAIIVAAMVVAGAVGWSLNSLSRANRQTAEAAGDRAARPSRTDTPASAVAASLGEVPTASSTVPAAGDAPIGPSERTPEQGPAASAPTAAKPDGDKPSGQTGDMPTRSSAGNDAKGSTAAAPPPKTDPPPSPTDVKPPEGAKPPPTAKQPPTQPTPPPGGRTLFQEVVVTRRPTFNVSGLTISQDLKYRVISKLHVGARASDGTLEVKQVIYETRLEKSESLSRAAFEESLRAMRGQEFRYTLGKDNEIVKFTGPKDNRKVVKADGLGGEGFLLSSVMDDDGWKELAQLSFFQPPSPLKRGERFERKLVHNWGALGSWYGKTIYAPAGERSGEQRIDYAHFLHYVMPEKKDAELPFEITAASFKIDQASGSIQWNPKTARIASATERFVVRGTVTTKVLGQSVEAQVEESQDLALRVMDRLPAETKK